MATIRTLAPLSLLAATPLLAQPSTSDCNGAIQLCGGVYTETSAPVGTGSVYEFTGTCNLNLESSSIWYTFTVQEAGNLSFILDPANDVDDYDWGLFNITNGGCAGINAQNGSSPEVNCNSYGNFGFNGPTGISSANGGTGTSNGPGNLNGPAYNADLPVTAGQTYALVVMNWSNSPNGYSIDFTQSTASIYDENPPSLLAATKDCTGLNIHLEFSEPIVTTSVGAADATLTAPSGAVFPFISATPDNATAAAQTGFTMGLASQPVEDGPYTITITSVDGNVEDLCGNTVLDTTFTVMLYGPMTYAVEVTPACNGTGGAIEAEHLTGGTPPVIFYLQGAPLPGGSATGLSPGSYTLTVEDSMQCQIHEVLIVAEHPLDVLLPQVQDSLSCSQASVVINGLEVLPAQEVAIQWSTVTSTGSDSLISTLAAPEVDVPGTYTVLVTDAAYGCTAEASVTIIETSLSNLDLSTAQMPNVISPNGDGINDDWRPFLPDDPGLDITPLFEEFNVAVYDRWGKLVHDTSTGAHRSWNARDVNDGTYFYSVAFRSVCGAVVDKEINGHVTILR